MHEIVDAGHVYLDCSACGAALLDVWSTRPGEPHTWKLRANCPFCGDSSFVTEIKGGFHPAGYGTPKQDDPDDVIPSTEHDGFDVRGDVVIFRVRKAGPDAKPVRR